MRKWNEHIDKTTLNVVESFGELSSEQMNWKPKPNVWSIAQNIEHVIVLNESYFPIVDAIRKGTYKASFLSKIGFLVSFFGKTLLKAVKPNRRKKTKTFSIWEPTKSEISQGIIERFKTHQLELKKMIESSQDFLDNGVIISSPINKNIVYTLEKAFDIIVTHEQRHYEQAKEVYLLIKNTSLNSIT